MIVIDSAIKLHLVACKVIALAATMAMTLSVDGQADTLFFTNSNDWEEERYPDVKGTAHFFEEYVIGDIYRRDSFVFRDILLNYNGFTNQFEVRKGDQYIVLESLWYQSIRVSAGKNEHLDSDVTFETDLHPTLKGKFREVIYQGEHLTLIHEFVVDKTEATKEIPGKTLVFERFVPVSNYYLIQDKKLSAVRPKKDALAKILGKEKDFYKFLKSEKIKKLNEKENLAKAVAWYDQQ